MLKALVLSLCALFLSGPVLEAHAAGEAVNLWFPPAWKEKSDKAKSIADAIAAKSGYAVKPRIAQSYPQILDAFSSDDYNLVYVGSFVQAIISGRKIGRPLTQVVDGKEMYSGVMIYPRGGDPEAIISRNPDQIAYTVGASSGESSAKAATGGKAVMGVPSHMAAARAVKAGKAKAAVVKNWWWEANKGEFPDFEVYLMPGISEARNPDNVLSASRSVSPEMADRIAKAAIESREVFGGESMRPFEEKELQFSLELMKKGGIDPMAYSW